MRETHQRWFAGCMRAYHVNACKPPLPTRSLPTQMHNLYLKWASQTRRHHPPQQRQPQPLNRLDRCSWVPSSATHTTTLPRTRTTPNTTHLDTRSPHLVRHPIQDKLGPSSPSVPKRGPPPPADYHYHHHNHRNPQIGVFAKPGSLSCQSGGRIGMWHVIPHPTKLVPFPDRRSPAVPVS